MECWEYFFLGISRPSSVSLANQPTFSFKHSRRAWKNANISKINYRDDTVALGRQIHFFTLYKNVQNICKGNNK